MAFGIATYRSNGTLSFEVSDRLLQIVFSYTPATGSSGSILMPNVTSVSGMIPINVPFEAVTYGGQGFTLSLQQPNVLVWQARPYSALTRPSSAKIIVVSSNV